jgi:hypothetical protein
MPFFASVKTSSACIHRTDLPNYIASKFVSVIFLISLAIGA